MRNLATFFVLVLNGFSAAALASGPSAETDACAIRAGREATLIAALPAEPASSGYLQHFEFVTRAGSRLSGVFRNTGSATRFISVDATLVTPASDDQPTRLAPPLQAFFPINGSSRLMFAFRDADGEVYRVLCRTVPGAAATIFASAENGAASATP